MDDGKTKYEVNDEIQTENKKILHKTIQEEIKIIHDKGPIGEKGKQGEKSWINHFFNPVLNPMSCWLILGLYLVYRLVRLRTVHVSSVFVGLGGQVYYPM